MKEIKNKIAESNLILIDLEEFYPSGRRIVIDIKDWLFQEIILKEKDFREYINKHDWSQYKDSYVALSCTVDAVIPSWAYLLITTRLTPFTKKVIIGDIKQLEIAIFQDIINGLSIEPYRSKPVMVRGCSAKPIPETSYVHLIEKLLPITKSIMFGEACSSVPLFKADK